jgi:hypothetical protein
MLNRCYQSWELTLSERGYCKPSTIGSMQSNLEFSNYNEEDNLMGMSNQYPIIHMVSRQAKNVNEHRPNDLSQ